VEAPRAILTRLGGGSPTSEGPFVKIPVIFRKLVSDLEYPVRYNHRHLAVKKEYVKEE